jgi:molybdate transport system substrate-binding protein
MSLTIDGMFNFDMFEWLFRRSVSMKSPYNPFIPNRRWLLVVFATHLFFAAPSGAAEKQTCGEGPFIIFAAASLTDAVQEVAARFAAETGCPASVSVAGSSTLARQIAEGAPAGVFLSANREWVSWLEENAAERLAGKPVTFARNALVVVAGKKPPESDGLEEMLSSRFAMGDPAHVPVGIYAKAALENIGIWDAVSGNAVFTENVRIALALAARGEAGSAIVYSTDALLAPDLVIAYTFAPATHPEIAYVGMGLANGGKTANAFLGLLSGTEGREIFSRFGFLPGDDGT